MYPGEVTRVIATFDRPGAYVWHCHILSHEEHDMMRPFYVGQLPSVTKNKPVVLAESDLQLKAMPNPFNSQVTIEFKLAHQQKVTIKLYDDKGALIKQVYSGTRSSGLQRFVINGTHLAQGIYLCEITIDDKRILRKLVLEK
jgi:spore coat protein A